MAFSIPTLVRIDDAGIQQYLDSLRQAVIELTEVPFLEGQELTVDLSATAKKFPHKLGRKPGGVFSLDGSQFTLVSSDKAYIELTGSQVSKVWVYA